MLSGFRKLKDLSVHQPEVIPREELELAWPVTVLTLTFTLLQLWFCFSIHRQSPALHSHKESQSNGFAVSISK